MSIFFKRKLTALLLFFISLLPGILPYYTQIDFLLFVSSLAVIVTIIVSLVLYSTKISSTCTLWFRRKNLDERELIVFKDNIKNILIFSGFSFIIVNVIRFLFTQLGYYVSSSLFIRLDS